MGGALFPTLSLAICRALPGLHGVAEDRPAGLIRPLVIARRWFAPGGVFLNETDMEPCITEDSATCERYAAGGSYDLAVEMFDGQLGAVGIGPGSQVELLDGSESAECELARTDSDR